MKLVRKEEIDTAKVKDLFETYKWDFNIQKRLEQSATLKKLNESSLNTLRIYTYRTLAGEYVLLVQSFDLEVKVRLMIMHRQVVVSAMFMMMVVSISVFFAITHLINLH